MEGLLVEGSFDVVPGHVGKQMLRQVHHYLDVLSRIKLGRVSVAVPGLEDGIADPKGRLHGGVAREPSDRRRWVWNDLMVAKNPCQFSRVSNWDCHSPFEK